MTHPLLIHPDGSKCVWIDNYGWFVPYDAGGEGVPCEQNHDFTLPINEQLDDVRQRNIETLAEELCAMNGGIWKFIRDIRKESYRLEARHVIDSEWLKNVVNDQIAERLHPEFGSEWQGPDGIIYKAVESMREERDAAIERANFLRDQAEDQAGRLGRLYADRSEARQKLARIIDILQEGR